MMANRVKWEEKQRQRECREQLECCLQHGHAALSYVRAQACLTKYSIYTNTHTQTMHKYAHTLNPAMCLSFLKRGQDRDVNKQENMIGIWTDNVLWTDVNSIQMTVNKTWRASLTFISNLISSPNYFLTIIFLWTYYFLLCMQNSFFYNERTEYIVCPLLWLSSLWQKGSNIKLDG